MKKVLFVLALCLVFVGNAEAATILSSELELLEFNVDVKSGNVREFSFTEPNSHHRIYFSAFDATSSSNDGEQFNMDSNNYQNTLNYPSGDIAATVNIDNYLSHTSGYVMNVQIEEQKKAGYKYAEIGLNKEFGLYAYENSLIDITVNYKYKQTNSSDPENLDAYRTAYNKTQLTLITKDDVNEPFNDWIARIDDPEFTLFSDLNNLVERSGSLHVEHLLKQGEWAKVSFWGNCSVQYDGRDDDAVAPIPEPASMLLLALGSLGIMGLKRFRK